MLGQRIAKLRTQRPVGHIQAFVGTQPVGDFPANTPFKCLDARKGINRAFTAQVIGVAGHVDILKTKLMIKPRLYRDSAGRGDRVPV